MVNGIDILLAGRGDVMVCWMPVVGDVYSETLLHRTKKIFFELNA